MARQENAYKGSPPRPYVRLQLIAPSGRSHDIDAVVDTGSPYNLIIEDDLFEDFAWSAARGIQTNFGAMRGGWLRIVLPGLDMTLDAIGFAGRNVIAAVQESHRDFTGLVGLPLLSMLEYGGDAKRFWIQSPSNRPNHLMDERNPI